VKVRRVIKQDIDIPDMGERFKKARLEVQAIKGVSLMQVCKAAGVSRNYWYQIENENTQVLLESTLRKIEAALSTTLNRQIDLGVNFEEGSQK
jgi:transcriptional regulator with XRE-family HTH domain